MYQVNSHTFAISISFLLARLNDIEGLGACCVKHRPVTGCLVKSAIEQKLQQQWNSQVTQPSEAAALNRGPISKKKPTIIKLYETPPSSSPCGDIATSTAGKTLPALVQQGRLKMWCS